MAMFLVLQKRLVFAVSRTEEDQGSVHRCPMILGFVEMSLRQPAVRATEAHQLRMAKISYSSHPKVMIIFPAEHERAMALWQRALWGAPALTLLLRLARGSDGDLGAVSHLRDRCWVQQLAALHVALLHSRVKCTTQSVAHSCTLV